MLRENRKKDEKNRDFPSQRILKSRYFTRLKQEYDKVRTKYPDLSAVIQRDELFLPDFIFSKKLSSLEAISKYLIENCKLSIKEASVLLSRTNKNIWYAYNSSKKKSVSFAVKKARFVIPTAVLKNLDLSVLENIVIYLKEELDLPYHEIADILKRDDRTVWSVYNKANKKKASKEKNQKKIDVEIKKYKEISDAYIQFYNLSKKFSINIILTELEKQIFVPVDIFSDRLGSFESIVKFLVENYNLSFSEISSLLDRSYSSIWNAYSSSKEKSPSRFAPKLARSIPLSILRNKEFGVLENIVAYLRDVCGMSYREISIVVARDERTVWTSYQKIKKKMGENEV
jgi:predicted DNA-binding protein (UPF0251 family)